jgi:hypothetical protein
MMMTWQHDWVDGLPQRSSPIAGVKFYLLIRFDLRHGMQALTWHS